jgi:glycosyltransferase involved in cell wall biosynthesis
MRLMIVSTSCMLGVNRAAYRHLSSFLNVTLHLVIPVRSKEAAAHGGLSKIEGEPFEVTMLKMSGPHNRLERATGLRELIESWEPSQLLLEFDPATLIVWDVVKASRHQNLSISVIALENQSRHFIFESYQALKRFQLRIAVGGLIASWFLRSVQGKIQHVFTVCDDGTTVMTEFGFAGCITKIPLGFDASIFCQQDQNKISLTRQRLNLRCTTIAYFGRLIPEKGVDLLIEALSTLRDMPWQFLIDTFSTYKSPYEVELHSQIQELKLMDRIVYFDASHNEMPDYMNAADIVVLPSISTPKFKEQYGRVIAEAMACGKIVIGSKSGAIPELIGDAGFLVAEGDVSRLSEILRYLLTASQGELDSIRTKAYKRAHLYFSAARQADVIFSKLNKPKISI